MNFMLNKHRKNCTLEGVRINYKDIELLRRFITDEGKIMPKRISGIRSRNQKYITRAIKLARNLALLSFAEGYVPPHSVSLRTDNKETTEELTDKENTIKQQ